MHRTRCGYRPISLHLVLPRFHNMLNVSHSWTHASETNRPLSIFLTMNVLCLTNFLLCEFGCNEKDIRAGCSLDLKSEALRLAIQQSIGDCKELVKGSTTKSVLRRRDKGISGIDFSTPEPNGYAPRILGAGNTKPRHTRGSRRDRKRHDPD